MLLIGATSDAVVVTNQGKRHLKTILFQCPECKDVKVEISNEEIK